MATLTYSRSDDDHLVLQGTLLEQPVVIQLERDSSKLMLVNRGFHWVNDSPYAR